jgi:hypothetical protein
MARKQQMQKKGKNIQKAVIHNGSPPPCLKGGNQCRGCFGWPNMLTAAMEDPQWRDFLPRIEQYDFKIIGSFAEKETLFPEGMHSHTWCPFYNKKLKKGAGDAC